MISYLTGKIINKHEQNITVQTVGGVGYEIHVTPILYVDLSLEQEVGIYTYLAVRENALDLFGFQTLAEKDLAIATVSSLECISTIMISSTKPLIDLRHFLRYLASFLVLITAEILALDML